MIRNKENIMTEEIQEVPRTLMDSMRDLDNAAKEIEEFANDLDDHALELYSKQIFALSRQIDLHTKILRARGITNWAIDFDDE